MGSRKRICSLYLLGLRLGDESRQHDVADGFVVAAFDMEDARNLASAQAGDETPRAWYSEARSSCILIAEKCNQPRGVVLRSYRAA